MMGRASGALDMVSSERCTERYPRNDSLGIGALRAKVHKADEID